ncbi:MAG: hypothetical protein EHM78_19210 [Myxococcaceae bacterium]|nr:MAG: hypothetical protein EHM78_19210 [Myxococcaceae bacterium]
MAIERHHLFRLVPFVAVLLVAACVGQPDSPCVIQTSDSSPFLVQLRPGGPLAPGCPQGTQYQLILAQRYARYRAEDPATVVFQLAGSAVDPPSGAQASGKFTSFRVVPPSNVCLIPQMTAATDDSATPVHAPEPVAATTYRFSDVQVLSDTAHLGNQFQARAIVEYGVPGCTDAEYVAQGVAPLTPCIDDTICLPQAIATDVPFPAGRGLGSQLSSDYRAYCNQDPALLDNEALKPLIEEWGAGRGAYSDAQGNPRDVGLCFLSEPFPSLCPAGSTLSETGPCVVGPGSNPH